MIYVRLLNNYKKNAWTHFIETCNKSIYGSPYVLTIQHIWF